MTIFEKYSLFRVDWRFACFPQLFNNMLLNNLIFNNWRPIQLGQNSEFYLIRMIMQFVSEIKFDTQYILLDLWNFVRLCSNRE